MRVVLFVPNWKFADMRAHDTQGIAGVWAPTGLMYVASVLREAGHQVFIEDGAFWSEEELTDRILSHEPDIAGAFVIAMFWERTKKLLTNLKSARPDIRLLVGGHAPSALGRKCLEESPELDSAVHSEGEYTVRELVNAWEQGLDTAGIQGCVVRDAEGNIVENQPRRLIENLDELPFPAVDLVDLDRYQPSAGQVLRLPVMQVISSRGCTHMCLYCYRLMGDRCLRMRSPENVVDEIELYVREYGAKEIKFWDELFTHDKARVMEICRLINERDLDITWWCSARGDSVDEELLRTMKKAGCWCINFGVESAVQKNLDTLRKGIKIETSIEAIKLTHRVGIKTFGTYIFGIPGETFEEGLETIRLARKLRSYYTEFFPITPFPGAELYENSTKYGVVLRDMSDSGMLKEEIPFEPFSMSAKQIAELRKRAFRTVYLDPGYILMRLWSLRSWYEVRTVFRGAISLLMMLFRKKYPADS
ncbi:MAG: B12-binding domain-containing radical SAM protein [Candidatus Aegiribacteria sp.]|nr:B12-binding domain-containing radical SAM protein [Candidatus Aegiribacteria sp.]